MHTSLPSILAGELQEIANRKHVTVEGVGSEIINKGILLARAKLDPTKKFVLREDGSEREFDLTF